MKLSLHVVILLCFCSGILAQQPRDLAVQLSANVTASPRPTITLQWNADSNTTSIAIYRKAPKTVSWSEAPLATVPATATSWADTTVAMHQAYEYRVVREVTQGAGSTSKRFIAFGYLCSGIDAIPEPRGRVLVIVDSTVAGPLSSELAQFQQDLEAEAWAVDVVQVQRTDEFDPNAVEEIRGIISEIGRANRWDLQSIVLVGHVAVPYAGDIAPDGHVPDHRGAWPADGIYGDFDGVYTDATVRFVNAQRPVNANIVGDGKFDQSVFASPLEIPVGRIDFADLPAFASSEIELLRRYFEKNHAFRSGSVPVVMGGVIDDNFGAYGEFFAATAWRSFAPFGRDTAVQAGDWFGSLAGPSTYLWSYGCGAGSFTSCNGVGSTTDFAAKPTFAIFTQLFGSYFGDWNVSNNIMRAAIASGPRALTCAWAGRPAWYMHHMGLGYTMGYSTLISQNNRSLVGSVLGTYTPNVIYSGTNAQLASIGDGGVHMALMGDPTLRAVMKPVPGVPAVRTTPVRADVIEVIWDPADGAADGYVVYRWRSAIRGWELLTPAPVATTAITDSTRITGPIQYRVHAVTRCSTASGTYFDLGKGALGTVLPSTVESDDQARVLVNIYPNPASQATTVHVDVPSVDRLSMMVIDAMGRLAWEVDAGTVAAGRQSIQLPVEAFTVGVYYVRVTIGSHQSSHMLHVIR